MCCSCQAEAYPVSNDLVRRVAAHFAKYAYQVPNFLCEQYVVSGTESSVCYC